MTFAVLYKAFRERFIRELQGENYKECQVDGCIEPAWRNGYCYNCVTHSTNQRILLALRENNLLLKELLSTKSANTYIQVNSPEINQMNKEREKIEIEKRIMEEEEEFIPHIPIGKSTGSSKKKSIVLDNSEKLNSSDSIQTQGDNL